MMGWIIGLIILAAVLAFFVFLALNMNASPSSKELKKNAARAEELSRTLTLVRDIAVSNRYSDPGYDLIIHEIDSGEVDDHR